MSETDEQFLDSMEQWVIGSLVFKREHRERLFALARKGAEADVENARLREVLEPEFLGRIVYETWLKAADGPAWISYNDLAHLAPDDRAAIEQIVEAVRTALTPPKQENENE